jgi:hypothetical protein
MKTDAELEQLLRETLTGRAETVRDARRWVAPPVPLRPRRRWLPVLAAAAVVVLVAIGVAIGLRGRDSNPPTRPTPHPTPTVVPTVCTTPLPGSWRDAFRSAGVDVGGIGGTPLSVAADGTVVVYRDGGVHPGDPRDVVLVRPGQAPHAVYSVPNPDTFNVQSAYLDGHWLVVAIGYHGRPPKGTIPGDSPMPNVRKLVVLDLETGTQKTIAGMSPADFKYGRRSIQSATLLDGSVYWDERNRYAARTGVIKAYRLDSGTTRTVYRGPIGYVVGGAAGIVSDSRVIVPAAMPEPVRSATNPTTAVTAATDGSAWAWLTNAHTLGYWRPGQATPTYLHLRSAVESRYWPGDLVVSGEFVFIDGDQVVDTRSHAVAALSGRHLFGGSWNGGVSLANGDHAAGYAGSAGSGHWVDGYWQDPLARMLVLDTSTLPALKC